MFVRRFDGMVSVARSKLTVNMVDPIINFLHIFWETDRTLCRGYFIIKLRDKKWALSKFVWTDRPHGFTVPHVVLVAYVLGGSHMIARCHVQALGLAHAIIIRSLHIRRSSPWCNTSHGFVDNYFFEKSLIQSKLLFIIRLQSFCFMQRSFHYLSLSSHICVIGLTLCIIVTVIFDRECCILRKYTWYHNHMSTIINGTNVSIDLYDKYYSGVSWFVPRQWLCVSIDHILEASITTSAGCTTVSISGFTNH